MVRDRKDRLFSLDSDFSWEDLGDGVKRKIMSYTDELMLVKVAFETGSIGSLHSHFQTQMSYVESGAFEITLGDIKQVVKTGDTYYIPPDVVHGAVCLEKGILIDIFTPHREDFV